MRQFSSLDHVTEQVVGALGRMQYESGSNRPGRSYEEEGLRVVAHLRARRYGGISATARVVGRRNGLLTVRLRWWSPPHRVLQYGLKELTEVILL